MRLIGVDWAVQAKNVGLASASWDGPDATLDEVAGGNAVNPISTLVRWITSSPSGILAIDAPLGWPAPMVDGLSTHRAGASWNSAVDPFSRETDRFVRRVTGKRPLDVGAQLIARTAYSALHLLNELRAATRQALPLLWSTPTEEGWSVIEVYPAATLAARKRLVAGYSRSEMSRNELMSAMSNEVSVGSLRDEICRSPHRLDAVIAIIAAADFVRGECLPPERLGLAEREGWIWFRPPKA